MILPEITELTILGVFDRGKPNRERIVLSVREFVDVSPFALLLGLRTQSGGALPIRNNLLWLGNVVLAPDDLILAYTGPGDGKKTKLPNNSSDLYTCHWGYADTVLHNPEIVPMLVRFDGINIFDDKESLLLSGTQTAGKQKLPTPG